MGRLSGKRVLVTGAGQGIGRAAAEMCAAEGAAVIATDRNAGVLDGLRHDSVTTVLVDGTDRDAVSALAAAHGPFDAVVHCIGYVANGTVLDCDAEDWRQSFDVNVDSFYHVARYCLPGMIRNGGGSITCIASVSSSIKGVPNRAAYGASKAAMIGLVKSIAADYVEQQIRCNAICPGTVESPSLQDRMAALGESVGGVEKAREMFVSRQPMGRIGTPDEIAALCVYLSADESRFVTSQIISIDGGMTL